MQIGVLFNCQYRGIAAALRALLPGAEVIEATHAQLPEPVPEKRRLLASLNACDHLVCNRRAATSGPFSLASLQRTARRVHVLPALAFGGFHPDIVYVLRDDASPLVGPTGDYHSRIAVAAYLAGIGAAEAASMYNRLVFRRLGYLDRFAAECAVLREQWGRFGIDAAPLLRSWISGGCFMYSVNHPKVQPLLDLARVACARMGVAPENPDVSAADVPDTLKVFPIHPVFPDIAAAAEVVPEGMFCTGTTKRGPGEVLSPERFVTRSFQTFATVPRAELYRVDGVPAALAALDLT